MAEKKEPQEEQPASNDHTHQWRTSFNPDGSASQVCDCGAIQNA